MNKKYFILVVVLVLSVVAVLQPVQAQNGPTLGDTYDIGITANAFNPWRTNASIYEVGFSLWFFDIYGVDLTFSYVGKYDASYTQKYSGTSYDVTSGVTTTRYYHDGGYLEQNDVTSSGKSFTIMPKYKAISYKQSYLFIGVPIMISNGFKYDGGYLSHSTVWDINGTPADPTDDFISSIDDVKYTNKYKYSTWLGYGIAIGSAFRFESLPGLELNFTIGYVAGGPKKRSRTQDYKRTVTNYDAGGGVTSETIYTSPYGQNTINGDVREDETGISTRGLGALYLLGITYYFI